MAAAIAIAADIFIVCVTFLAAGSLIYSGPIYVAFVLHPVAFSFSLLVFIGGLTSLGLYRTISYTNSRRHFAIAARAYVLTMAVVFCIALLFRNAEHQRDFLFAFFLILPCFYAMTWSLLRQLKSRLQGQRFGRWNTLVVGFDKSTDAVLRRLRTVPELGYDIVKVVQAPATSSSILHVERSDVENAISEQDIEMIVLSSSHLNGSFVHLEDLCQKHSVRMSVISDESDYLFTRTNIYDLAGIPIFSLERRRVEFVKRVVKRGFDVVASALLLILLSPVFLIVGIATKIESRGPVFFRQRRALSDNEEPFEFYKFRSMVREADEIKESLVDLNESDGALFKIRNDPRLTKVGKFIRRHSIDELPQLFNVLKGEMSLVGPRPLPVDDFNLLQSRDHLGGYFRHRSKAKPGMTGLWQVSGRSDLGFREMVLLDLYYIEHQTILFDVEILFQTIPVVLFGKGAS